MKIGIRFPDGTRASRVFKSTDTMGKIRDFVDVKLTDGGHKIRNYNLSLNFPRRVCLIQFFFFLND